MKAIMAGIIAFFLSQNPVARINRIPNRENRQLHQYLVTNQIANCHQCHAENGLTAAGSAWKRGFMPYKKGNLQWGEIE